MKACAILFANFVDGADVGMVQSGGGLGLALKSRQRLWIFGHIVRQKLERDEAMQSRVLSLVDDAHPAAAQFLDDAIVRDGLADHAYPRNLRWPYVRALLLRKSKRYPVQGGLWVVCRLLGSWPETGFWESMTHCCVCFGGQPKIGCNQGAARLPKGFSWRQNGRSAPLDFSQLPLNHRLSRQRPRVRVPSSPPFFSRTCNPNVQQNQGS